MTQYAEMAEMLDVYHTAYKALSGTVHTGAHELRIHLNGDTPSEITEIYYGSADNDIDSILLTATGLMLRCVHPLTDRFGIKYIPELGQAMEHHNALEGEHTHQVDGEPAARSPSTSKP